jgi:NADP-dependent 3-hydroxy acid dehydrogenase YdfG
VRRGLVHGRRLARATPRAGGRSLHLDGTGTVLLTGAPGALAELVARHLVTEYGAAHLLLASRRGPAAPGAARLAAALAGRGAAVRLSSCDTADRAALAALLGQIQAAHPLTAVIHAAGVLDDGVISALTPRRVDYVLRPKVDAAVHLDELTAGLDLSAFVLFSSAAATFGAPGQGNYAAANAFLDALACDRRSRGRPAVSVAWGLWAQDTGMTAHLDETARRRASGGAAPLAAAQGLELLDAALGLELPVVAALNLNLAGLRAQAATLPPFWRGLVRGPASSPQGGGPAAADTLREQLAGLPEAGQDRLVLDLVRGQAAAVLGHPSGEAVSPDAAFRDLGFDSLTAVELRNRLGLATGLRLSATLVFDHPSPAVLAGWLRSAIGQDGSGPAATPPVLAELDKLETILSATAIEDAESDKITARLEAVLSKWKAARAPADAVAADRELLGATTESIFDIIDKEFGEVHEGTEFE